MLNNKITITASTEACRLETPRAMGFRTGMSSTGMIGRRLENLFEVPAETPRGMDELLKVLDRRDGDD